MVVYPAEFVGSDFRMRNLLEIHVTNTNVKYLFTQVMFLVHKPLDTSNFIRFVHFILFICLNWD